MQAKKILEKYDDPSYVSKLSEGLKKFKENFINTSGIEKYKEYLSNKVKSSITDTERARRSELMKNLHKTTFYKEEYKIKLSDQAKKTSARKDIQEKRAKVLSDWRKNNPEDFKQKCTVPMLASNKNSNKIHGSSKSEDILLTLLSKYENFSFEKNCFLEGKEFDDLKSKEKQVDIGDKVNNIYVEFDGAHHFKEIYGSKKKSKLEKLNDTKKRDKLLEDYINRTGHTLIRISYDQFLWRRHNSRFTESCISKLDEIFKDIKPGIYKIGKMYE